MPRLLNVVRFRLQVDLEKDPENQTEAAELEEMHETSDSSNLTPCVLQYVIFPPVSSLER